jgi:hypothetical protein
MSQFESDASEVAGSKWAGERSSRRTPWGSPNYVPMQPGISCRAIKLQSLRDCVAANIVHVVGEYVAVRIGRV